MDIVQAYGNVESAIRRFARRFVSGAHDIEDICQETVTRALEAERAREIDDPGAFLFGVARNVVRRRLDKQSRSLIDFVNDFSARDYLADEPAIEESMDRHDQVLLLMEAVATLPPQCQRVFVMKKVYGYSHKEIAARLNISISTVEKHVAAGFKRCLEELDRLQAQGPARSRQPAAAAAAGVSTGLRDDGKT